MKGTWRRGPGGAVFRAAERELGELPVVAEDLGVITEPVVRLRHELGFPGMVVLQFALGGDPANPHLPAEPRRAVGRLHGHARQRHDPRLVASRSRAEDRAWADLDAADPAWSLLGAAWASRAALAIAPLQDVLDLGTEARMNLPGTESGNWQWRYDADDLTPELAGRLRAADRAEAGVRRARTAAARA